MLWQLFSIMLHNKKGTFHKFEKKNNTRNHEQIVLIKVWKKTADQKGGGGVDQCLSPGEF